MARSRSDQRSRRRAAPARCGARAPRPRPGRRGAASARPRDSRRRRRARRRASRATSRRRGCDPPGSPSIAAVARSSTQLVGSAERSWYSSITWIALHPCRTIACRLKIRPGAPTVSAPGRPITTLRGSPSQRHPRHIPRSMDWKPMGDPMHADGLAARSGRADRHLLTLANIVQGNDPATDRCRERAPAHAAQARAGAPPRGASPRRHGRAGRAPRSRRGVPGLRRQGARGAGRDLLTRHHAEPRPARGGRADRSVPLDERCPSHHAGGHRRRGARPCDRSARSARPCSCRCSPS